jgi:uncharacterized protein YgiM (DUF1202 family)
MRRSLDGHSWQRIVASVAIALLVVLPLSPGVGRAAPRGGAAAIANLGGSPIKIGDDAWVDDGPLHLRPSAGTDGTSIDTLPTGTRLTILDGPVNSSAFTWFEVELANGQTGWVAGDFLRYGSSFAAGDEIEVIDGPLNLRAASGSSAAILTQLENGDTGVVLSGPVNSGAYAWYEVEVDASTTGWVAGQFVALAGSATFADGDVIEVVDGPVNMRSRAGLSGSVFMTLANGSTVTVLLGPVLVDGFNWYKISFGSELPGWVAGDFFSVRDVNGPFAVGDTVRTTIDDLNLRRAPGTGLEIIDTLRHSSFMEVTGGPVAADGYTWYLVAVSEIGEGWVAGELVDLWPRIHIVE